MSNPKTKAQEFVLEILARKESLISEAIELRRLYDDLEVRAAPAEKAARELLVRLERQERAPLTAEEVAIVEAVSILTGEKIAIEALSCRWRVEVQRFAAWAIDAGRIVDADLGQAGVKLDCLALADEILQAAKS